VTLPRRLPVTAVLAATLALTGCTQASGGTPMPDKTTSTSSESDTADSGSRTEAPSERPREINLKGKDPCVIPQADWSKFGIKGQGKADQHPDFKSPDCYYTGAGDVALVVTAGIEIWTKDKYNAEIKDVDPIDEFPTITVASNVDRQACLAIVDVAHGQFLMTTATPDPSDPSKPERCDLAYQLAESAMKTLVAS
jgi:uncharacterized protein DUF3558